MTLPTLTVEIGHLTGWTLGVAGESELGQTTTLAEMTFDDITSKVRSLSIRRGRNHELDRVEAGTASVRLLNQDGTFNPTNTSSVYYPNIRPMIPIRIRASFFGGPASITGLTAWYDFSDVGSLWQDTGRTSAITADGQTIKGVTDKSGVGNHLSEATNGPAYKISIQNGNSVARFDGTNDQLSATITADASRTTFVVVTKRTAPGVANRIMLAMGDDSAIFFTSSAIHATHWLVYANEANGITDVAGDATAWNILAADMASAASASVYANGGTATSLDPHANWTTGSSWQLGARPVAHEWGDYDIGEVLMYDSALGTSNLNDLGSYLGTKWGITWTAV